MTGFNFNQTPNEQSKNLQITANSLNKIQKANEAIQLKQGSKLRKRKAKMENARWLLNEIKEIWE